MTEPTTLVRLTKKQYDAVGLAIKQVSMKGSLLADTADTVFAEPFTPAHPPKFDPVKVRFPDGSIRRIEPIAYERPLYGVRTDHYMAQPVFDVPGYVFDRVIDVDVEWRAAEGRTY